MAMHDIAHTIKEIEAHPDSLLVFEVHVKPKIKDLPPEKPPEARGPHNGYPLTRKQQDGDEAKDQEIVEDIRWKNYGWSFLPLFNLEDELNAGVYKMPIYRPPANVNMDLSNYANQCI